MNWENFVFEILYFALMLFITGIVVPSVRDLLDTKIGEENRQKIFEYVDLAVKAAEQTFSHDQGEAKKVWVAKYLESVGIKWTHEIDAMVEAAVLELHNALIE